MSEIRDPAIKLFGKTIQILLPDDPLLLAESKSSSSITPPIAQDCKKSLDEELATAKREETSSLPSAEESSCMNEDPKTPTTDKEASSSTNFNNTQKEDPPSDTNNNSEEKPPKPDKILPCPRCNSMDTKFCYYNNYNVNQPRHFCKNCQRYWTAGGTMRNTPVGSGRRKNKSTPSASQFCHVIVSEAALQAAQAEAKSVLTFGPDVPLCESMASALNLADKSQNSLQNDIKEPKSTVSDDSSTTTVLNDARGLKNFQGYHPLQVPCFPAPPWPYPWNPAQYRPQPTSFGPSGFPVSFYPPPQYWGCTMQPPSPWAMPWLAPPNDGFTRPGSNPSSPLGKHSRDGNLLGPSENGTEQERTVLIPKTLRINDPNDAAKSSVWSTLGIKNDASSNTSLFKAFQPKGNTEKNHVQENSLVLQANPAALSRSLNFHESS